MNIPSLSQKLLTGRTVKGPVSARINIDGRDYLNFFGNGYLALHRVPEIRQAVREVFEAGIPFAQQAHAALGSTDPVFASVERAAAFACATEASVYFASGYLVGSVGLASLEQAFQVLLLDEHAHPSLQDAAKLTGLPSFTFAHCSVDSVQDTLRRQIAAGQRPLIVTDGVFATSGRLPPLADYVKLLERYDGSLFVDESHAFGVVGANGRGAAEYCGFQDVSTSGATLSKAYCAHGAIVGCSAAVSLRLREAAPIRATCAGSPLSAVAAAASLNYVGRHPEMRQELQATTDYLRKGLREAGFDVLDSPAPIVSFQFGTRLDMLALQHRLFGRGIHIYHSTYTGAGPEGTIRCAVFADHSRADIDALVSAIS